MRTRFTILFVGLIAALSFAVSAQSGPAETMLEAARKKEVVDGDLNGAIKEYQEIVARYQKTDRHPAFCLFAEQVQVIVRKVRKIRLHPLCHFLLTEAQG